MERRTKSIEETCKLMPKVELHAHLNGSISESILEKLQKKQDSNSNGSAEIESNGSNGTLCNSKPNLNLDKIRSLDECWAAFKKIHDLIRTPEDLYEATREVIKEFVEDGVIYLELRTTPKKVHQIQSKQQYIQTIIKAIMDCKELEIIVKLLISIDRRGGEEEGEENLYLAQQFMESHPEIVVGMDISGDPNFAMFPKSTWILTLMEKARGFGIPISCHLSEIINPEETLKFLEFQPERVSHGQFLHPSTGGNDILWETAKSLKIPIEVCITSNLISGVCPSIENCYVKNLFEDGIPFIIGTDDPGVFVTSLSKEYVKFSQLVNLNLNQLKLLNVSSISYCFGSTDDKSKITREIEQWWNKNVSEFSC